MRAQSLAARVLEGAGKFVQRKLADGAGAVAVERCLESALRAFLVVVGAQQPSAELERLETLFKTWFALPDVGHELGALLRGRRLSVEELELLMTEHLPEGEPVPRFRAAIEALESAFWHAAGSEPALGVLSLEPPAASVADFPEGDVNADQVWAHNVVGTQLNFLFPNRMAGPESGRGAEPAEDATRHLRDCYLNRLVESVGHLALGGIDPAVAGSKSDASLRLDAVYTALLTQTSREPERMAEGAPRLSPALEQLNRHDRLVLLGDPGSGKSTFVSFVALCLAGELLGSEHTHLKLLTAPLPAEESDEPEPPPTWDHGPLLPVPVVLRDFAARGLPGRGEAGTADQLWRFLEGELERGSLTDYGPHLKETLRRDGALILLDGLDEVPEAEGRRVQILQSVRDFAATFHRCRFLVTCRTYAYQHQQWRLPDFTEAVLTPLHAAQVRHFVDRWYAHVGELRGLDDADAQGRAERLKAAIFGSDRLRPLAERPLLLTLMASLHAWRGGSLPERREELYHDAVQLLLDFWEQRQVVVDASGRPVVQQESLAEWLRVDRARVRRLLNEMAYRAHASQEGLKGTADIAEQDLVGRLMSLSDNPDARPARLVEYLRDRAGLLPARGVGVYTFPHRTFQEYLAACHLTDHDFPQHLAELACGDKGRWREVVLLAAAKAARGSAANPWHLADALCFRGVGDERRTLADTHGAHLAGLVLCESADYKEISDRLEEKLRLVRGWQADLLSGTELPALDRSECGRSLARLGEVRPEVTAVERMQLCWVPPGAFRMGTDKSDQPGVLDGTPAHDPIIPYGFWIGRYPVTQAQYRSFVEAGGYQDEQYWLEAQEAGRWQHGAFTVGEEVISEPRKLEEPFNLNNHPAAGVSWFEARAYCRWLTDHLRRRGVIGAEWTVDLPSELEWEKAARGGYEIPPSPIIGGAGKDETDGKETGLVDNPEAFRIYPWGEEIDGERANWDATAVGSTSAVGSFPSGRSPYGCEEMSGNVWEWTRSRYGDYPYPETGEDRAIRERFDPAARWVLRGGSFLDVTGYLRCAARCWFAPADRVDFVGFRVVFSPSGL